MVRWKINEQRKNRDTCYFRTFANKLSVIMEKQMRMPAMARFDTKLSKAQKELFEYAASIGGFRTLTEFIISSVQEKAKTIIEQHKTTLASERDMEIFFDALTRPEKPNKKLIAAAQRYKNALAGK
jgi:uncharacterized protein (DUF1778 family)